MRGGGGFRKREGWLIFFYNYFLVVAADFYLDVFHTPAIYKRKNLYNKIFKTNYLLKEDFFLGGEVQMDHFMLRWGG